MPSFGGYSREYLRKREQRRAEYANKLRGFGIVKDSNKWRHLMHRKGL